MLRKVGENKKKSTGIYVAISPNEYVTQNAINPMIAYADGKTRILASLLGLVRKER